MEEHRAITGSRTALPTVSEAKRRLIDFGEHNPISDATEPVVRLVRDHPIAAIGGGLLLGLLAARTGALGAALKGGTLLGKLGGPLLTAAIRGAAKSGVGGELVRSFVSGLREGRR